MSAIEAIISDFGGVLTSPLVDVFAAFEDASGVSPRTLGDALLAISERRGAHPLFELETGRMTERQFFDALAAELKTRVGRTIDLDDFGRLWFAHLEPNQPLIDYMRDLRARGYRMAICTNNVREWEPMWRAMLPVDEIFDHVIDSGFVGVRKPEPGIYELTLTELGVPAGAALFLDDIEVNCTAARELGIHAVWFRSTKQAIAEIEEMLAT